MRSNVSKPCSLLAWQLAALKIRNLQWTGMQLKHIGCTALAALAMALVQTIASPALLGHFLEADYRAWRNVVKTQNLVIE